MKKNKITNSNIISKNGSKQILNLLQYQIDSDLNDKSFLPWDVMNQVVLEKQ